MIASPHKISASLVNSFDVSERPAWNFVYRAELTDIIGATRIIMRACYQQNMNPIASPVSIPDAASSYGPILSPPTPLIIEVSEAIEEVKTPAEFSLRSNHPIFFSRICS